MENGIGLKLNELAGGDDGTRTRDLMRDSQAGFFHSVHTIPYFTLQDAEMRLN